MGPHDKRGKISWAGIPPGSDFKVLTFDGIDRFTFDHRPIEEVILVVEVFQVFFEEEILEGKGDGHFNFVFGEDVDIFQ